MTYLWALFCMGHSIQHLNWAPSKNNNNDAYNNYDYQSYISHLLPIKKDLWIIINLPNITQLFLHHPNSLKVCCMVECISSQQQEL